MSLSSFCWSLWCLFSVSWGLLSGLHTLYFGGLSESLCILTGVFESESNMSLLSVWVSARPEACYTLCHFWDSLFTFSTRYTLSLLRLSTLYVTFSTLFRISLGSILVYLHVHVCRNRIEIELKRIDFCVAVYWWVSKLNKYVRSWTSMYEVEQVCTKLNKYVTIEYFGGHFCVCVRFVLVFQMGCVLVSLYADGWCWIWIKHVPRRC